MPRRLPRIRLAIASSSQDFLGGCIEAGPRRKHLHLAVVKGDAWYALELKLLCRRKAMMTIHHRECLPFNTYRRCPSSRSEDSRRYLAFVIWISQFGFQQWSRLSCSQHDGLECYL